MAAQTIIPVTFYQIFRVDSTLSLRPQNPNDSGSALIQDQAGAFPAPDFSWGFILTGIKNGLNVYRIFNGSSSFSIDARGNQNPPTSGEIVQQHTWINSPQQAWVFDGDRFLSAYDANFCWEVKNASPNTGAVIELNTVNKTATNQMWKLVQIEGALFAASAGKTT